MPEGDRQSGAVSRDERCGSQQKRVRVAGGRCARVSGILSVPSGTSNPAEHDIHPAHVCTASLEMIVVVPAMCALRLPNKFLMTVKLPNQVQEKFMECMKAKAAGRTHVICDNEKASLRECVVYYQNRDAAPAIR